MCFFPDRNIQNIQTFILKLFIIPFSTTLVEVVLPFWIVNTTTCACLFHWGISQPWRRVVNKDGGRRGKRCCVPTAPSPEQMSFLSPSFEENQQDYQLWLFLRQIGVQGSRSSQDEDSLRVKGADEAKRGFWDKSDAKCHLDIRIRSCVWCRIKRKGYTMTIKLKF